MTEQEFIAISKILTTAYPNSNFLAESYAKELWYASFKDIDAQAFKFACSRFILQSEYPPTIAGIRKMCTPKIAELTEQEAWATVKNVLCDCSFENQGEIFDKLPPTIQRAVGSPDILREWAYTDTRDLNTVIASNFMRDYRAVLEATRIEKAMPTRLQIGGGNYDRFGICEKVES